MPILGIVASSISGNLWPTSSFESIQTITGAGNPATVTFNSIPQTYKHLQIRSLARNIGGSTGVTAIYLQINGGGSTNLHRLYGNGSTAQSVGYTTSGTGGDGYIDWACVNGGDTANIFGVSVVDLQDYTSSTRNKTYRSISGTDLNVAGTGSRIYLNSGAKYNTAAITSITLVDPSGAGFATTSSFALYGIKG